MPDRTGEALPYVPSQDGAKLAVALRAVEWELDSMAHTLPAGQCPVDRIRALAPILRTLADHLDAVAKTIPSETVETGEVPGSGNGCPPL